MSALFWRSRSASALIYIILAFVVGFFLPRYFLNSITKNRQRDLRWGLADALDLMVVSVEAGLGLNAAMMKVATRVEGRTLSPSRSSLSSQIWKSASDASVMKRCAIWLNAPALTICAVSSRC